MEDRGNAASKFTILGLDSDEMRAVLDNAFRNADVEGVGMLGEAVISEIIQNAFGEELDDSMYYAVMSLAIPDDEGNVWYDDVTDWAYQTLEGLTMEYSPR